MFDPNFAAQTLTAALVAELSIVMPIAQHISIADLQRELPCYTSAARSVSFSSDDVDLYTDAVLSFCLGPSTQWCKQDANVGASGKDSICDEPQLCLL